MYSPNIQILYLEKSETPGDPHPGYHFSRSTKNLEFYTIDKQDNNSKESLKITLVDSVGYGDSMELESWLSHITGYIESGVRNFKTQYFSYKSIKKR
jgi:hypothetical protein